MAKATTTIRQSLNYQSQHAEYFAANQALFNRVVAFYFDCIQAHEGVLDLKNKEALTVLETLTHATKKNTASEVPITTSVRSGLIEIDPSASSRAADAEDRSARIRQYASEDRTRRWLGWTATERTRDCPFSRRIITDPAISPASTHTSVAVRGFFRIHSRNSCR